jgi:hypothetical protein
MHKAPLIFTFHQQGPIHLKCEINLSRLFLTERERNRFETNWPEFLASDPYNKEIYQLRRNKLFYTTEQLIPVIKDNRPSLLLVLGNPASISIDGGMFFAFDAKGKEHRFWKDILKPAGIPEFQTDYTLPVRQLNERRRDQLLHLDYNSPFRIGLCVYISMPSTASGPWSGVAGIQKLIGVQALRRLEVEERKRILACAKKFMASGGTVVAFQKNAWNGLKSDKDPLYSLDSANKNKLKGAMRDMSQVPLYGVPPTRLAGPAKKVLEKFLIRKRSQHPL